MGLLVDGKWHDRALRTDAGAEREAVQRDWAHGARVEDAFTSGKLLARLVEQGLPASQA